MSDPEPVPIHPSGSGQTASSLIHDLNNQLLVISCSSSQLLSTMRVTDPDRPLVASVCDAVTRAAALIRQLSHVLHGQDSQQSSEHALVSNNSVASDSGVKTILLVEDKSEVRRLLRNVLILQGYNVLEAGHGPEALSVAARFAGQIHLLVTDMRMPEMSGIQLAESLRTDFPGLPSLFLSGIVEDSDDLDFTVSQSFLRKPFKMPEFLLKVRELLDARKLRVEKSD
ncbi:MAG: response regulator [Planctomycetes bacterium]|nr:response regulator [Planctomycetota bacterium]